MFSTLRHLRGWLEAINTGIAQLIQGQNRNTQILTQILQKEDTIMADIGALQSAVTSLASDVPAVLDALKTLLAENTALKGGTVNQSQIDELNNLDASIKSALANVTAAAAGPVVSQPGEPATTPTDTTSVTGTGTPAEGTSTEIGSTASTDAATSTSEPSTETNPSASETEPTESNTSPHS